MRNNVISIGAILSGVVVLACVAQAQPQAESVGVFNDSGPLYVPQDYPTIHAAVDAAGAGDTILLAPGVYTGPGNRGVTINKPVTIRGLGGPEQCIIDCQESGRGFSVELEDANAEVAFEGLTITGGLLLVDRLPDGYDGGGVLLDGCGTARFTDCQIRDNHILDDLYAGFPWNNQGLPSHGGGICCLGTWNLLVQGCVIEGNRAMGGRGSDCLDIAGGNGYGGGIYCQAGEMTIRDSAVLGNIALGGFTPNSYDCYEPRYGWGIGGGICGGDPNTQITLLNCLVVGNQQKTMSRSISGNGLAQCSGEIRNCTFRNPDNLWDENGSLSGFKGRIVNSIFWKEEILSPDTLVTYCLTTNPIVGVGNITSDPNIPVFVDPGQWNGSIFIRGDYHLQSQYGRWDPMAKVWVKDTVTSPCIDAGDPADTGWMNELWPNGRRIDIGAYGGTAEASMSGNAIGLAADLNFDDAIDVADLLLVAQAWTKHQVLLPADLTRDGRVGIEDLAAMAENWLN